MSTPPPFAFAETAPDPRLAPWVSRYWEFQVHAGAPPVHRVPPDGCTSLLVARGPGRVPVLIGTGPWLEPLAVPVSPGDRFVGVRLQPGAAGEFLGRPPAELCNRAGPAFSLFGHPSHQLAATLAATPTLDTAAAVMNAAFLAAMPDLHAPDPMPRVVVEELIAARGKVRIAAIAERLSVSPRTMLRRFRTATGIAPKEYARVVRFRLAAMELLNDGARLSEVAASGGYADQPHLTREWARLLGITPRQLAEVVQLTAHQNIAP